MCQKTVVIQDETFFEAGLCPVTAVGFNSNSIRMPYLHDAAAIPTEWGHNLLWGRRKADTKRKINLQNRLLTPCFFWGKEIKYTYPPKGGGRLKKFKKSS